MLMVDRTGTPMGWHIDLQDERIRRVLDLVRSTDISKRLSIVKLAAAAGLSVSRFGHLFRDQTGVTPRHMLNRIRFQEAALLLTETELAIKEVSWRVGFQSVTSFSRLFKKQCAVSPSEYRRAKRAGKYTPESE